MDRPRKEVFYVRYGVTRKRGCTVSFCYAARRYSSGFFRISSIIHEKHRVGISVPILKSTRSKTGTLARRLCFDLYYSFVITDFFEGLHYGHYPRQCGICKKYFLMTSVARQKYCTGYAPFKVKGKAITCRKYAARINRKEYADANPIIRLYKNRCSALRMERKRGKHDDILTNAALAVAKERMQLAKNDPDYANGQYETDMSREELYAEADR